MSAYRTISRKCAYKCPASGGPRCNYPGRDSGDRPYCTAANCPRVGEADRRKASTHADYVARVEQVLRDAGRPYVAVDDAKKAIFSGAQIKSFDFLIYMTGPEHLLAIVLPPSRSNPTEQQQSELRQWVRVFGTGFVGAFIHATDEPMVWLLGHDPHQPRPLRSFLDCKAAPADPPPAEAPTPDAPALVPTCVDGQAVFDVGCVGAGTQLGLF